MSYLKSVSITFLILALMCIAFALEPAPVSAQGAQAIDQLDPGSIPQFVDPLVIPPAMPRKKVIDEYGQKVDYYEIAVRQFDQQILPAGLYPATTVWSYGSAHRPGTVAEGGSFNYPAFTVEGKVGRPIRVKWINDLVDANGDYLPHLLPVDQTLHWANPGGVAPDSRGNTQDFYTGPVPIITHVHGAHTTEDSDGYPEAWYLPNANNIPAEMWQHGSKYDEFGTEFALRHGPAWTPGSAIFQYPNEQRAATLWYHDHSLGMTRVNVYAGPAGFWLLRGGSSDRVIDAGTGTRADLPGPAPARNDAAGTAYYEIPVVIQDRTFTPDGQLYYPDNRAFFEDLEVDQLQIPLIPDDACGGPSDIAPTWVPEFFGNTLVTNGKTWPYLDVEPRRYRFRFLNGCQSRFLILATDNDLPLTVIGADGGFLRVPTAMTEMLLGPAERADVIIDFGGLAEGTVVTLVNTGPDTPFGGGVAGVDYDPADPATTGKVMEFRVGAATGDDPTTPVGLLDLPNVPALGPAVRVRRVSLNEEESSTVFVTEDAASNVFLDCAGGVPFGPKAALLGTVAGGPSGVPLLWNDAITETPTQGETEIWKIYNFTADAHPIHIHQVQFRILNRKPIGGLAYPRTEYESSYKDTVIAYPGEITRLKARFDIPGLFVWHCHILEHEDNEMMRPLSVLAAPDGGGGGTGGGGTGGGGTGGGDDDDDDDDEEDEDDEMENDHDDPDDDDCDN